MLPVELPFAAHRTEPKGLPMTRETATRAQIALLIYLMTQACCSGLASLSC